MNNPKPEHRITFLEKQFLAMGGHLEGIQEDIENLEAHVDLGFQQAHSFVQERFGEINQRLDRIESDITSIKATQEQILELLKKQGNI